MKIIERKTYCFEDELPEIWLFGAKKHGQVARPKKEKKHIEVWWHEIDFIRK
jgi:hypothetical protein